MPYPNFISARVVNPNKFKWIKMLKELPNGIQLYGGILKDGDKNTTTVQTYRFPKFKFSDVKAKKWLDDKNIKVLLFEPAVKENIVTGDIAVFADKIGKKKKRKNGIAEKVNYLLGAM